MSCCISSLSPFLMVYGSLWIKNYLHGFYTYFFGAIFE
jgi:hypothetical protein